MRQLDEATLTGAARYYAEQYEGRGRREFVWAEFFKFAFKDEFEFLYQRVREMMGRDSALSFERNNVFSPREDAIFERLLREKLAIDRHGEHIGGCVGTTQIGMRDLGFHDVEVEAPWSIRRRKALGMRLHEPGSVRETIVRSVRHYWPIYAGEGHERADGSSAVDPLPEGVVGLAVGASNPGISNECAILSVDATVDNLDEGTGAAVIQGRTGTQPADVDTTTTGTLLFTLVMSDPAFGAAADNTGKATATASAITDDSSADATGTLTYCRVSATNDGATPLDDHMDGGAGTSASDFVFNTVSIVAASTVSMSSFTYSQNET